jgi:Mrp family chromosome partitioning ATPase
LNPQQTWIISELSGSAESLLSLPPLLVTSMPAASAPAVSTAARIGDNDPPLAAKPRPAATADGVQRHDLTPAAESPHPRTAGVEASLATARASREAAARRAAIEEEVLPPSPKAASSAAARDERADSPGPDFQAAWEVDEFNWTADCEALCQRLGGACTEAGSQLKSATREGLRVLAISSAHRGEGRTSTALLLARAAASAGVRVALFDADLENPQVAEQLQIVLESDWLTSLRGSLPLEEAAVTSLADQLVVFPLRAEAREKIVRLNEPQITALLAGLTERFELVIVDLGPFSHDERRLFPAGPTGLIDAAIVVRDVRTTSADEADQVARAWRGRGVAAVGIAENYVRDE